jgi:hypothetical protein
MYRLNKKIKRQKFLVATLIIAFTTVGMPSLTGGLTNSEASEFGMSSEFLIQSGISFYDQGRFLDAMNEFRKALMVDPNSIVAKSFLRRIQQEFTPENQIAAQSPQIDQQAVVGQLRQSEIERALDRAEMEQGVLISLAKESKKETQGKKSSGYEIAQKPTEKQQVAPQVAPLKTEKTIILDDKIKATQPNTLLELEQESSVLIKGNNIKRFLNVVPEKVLITRYDQNTILATGQGVGQGVFHVWDDNGRWTFSFQGKHKKYFGSFGDEYQMMVKKIGLSEPFKVTYSFDWNTFHTGRRLDTTERQTLSFSQGVTVRGETPYGNYYSYLNAIRLNKRHELENLGMGLTDAHFWGLDRLNIRWFDFAPIFSGYKFPTLDLRGVMLNAPMFQDKINYTAFWGGVPEGNYTHLSPGLGRTRDAYLEGIGLQFVPTKNSKYKLYYAHTYGSELNSPMLTSRAFGLGSFYNLGNLNFNSEVAYDDREHISYTSGARLSLSKTNISLDFTEEDRDFVSSLGGTASGGFTSTRLGIDTNITENLSISNHISATRDSNLYNPNDPKRPNYTFDSEASLRIDPFTNAYVGYGRDDTKGSISPSISEKKRLGLRKQFFFIKKINTFFNYTNLRNKYYLGSSSNYDQNTFNGGLGFNIIGDLYWSMSKGINFIKNRITGEEGKSHVLDNSLSYYSRIFDTPFYGRLRVSYRDEEQAESALSFLSGEDRLEFATELDYRPNAYLDAYLSGRVANVWAENEGAPKHLDAEVRYGLRLVWDTGLRWNVKGNIQGFVFYDLDGDTIKDFEEEGVSGVIINSTGEYTDTTNINGYYYIKNIEGKKSRVSIDMNSMPRGYTLTTPSYYDIDIKHGATKRLDFGISTHAEIVGAIFVDLNGNNQFDKDEEGLPGVTVVLDGQIKYETEQGGQYLFRKVAPGEHTIAIDLRTLPTKYVPTVPLKRKFELEEGITFFYHVPLKVSK